MGSVPVSFATDHKEPAYNDGKHDTSIDQVSIVDSEKFATNPFLDPAIAEHYRTLYEDAEYECRHEFNPELEWSPQEEKKLVRKLDMHVCLWVRLNLVLA
jgi:hypothetical protein